jgi:hypothetical protein
LAEANSSGDSDFVSVRDLSVDDVPSIANFWFQSPHGFVERMGVDPSKLPSEEDMRRSLIEKCEANLLLPKSKLNALVVLYKDEPIGFHTLFPFTEGESGMFHAHIWNINRRGRGIAQHSYIRAARVFMERFALKKILYKTPIQNIGAIRVKEKLGIRCIGEELIGFGIIKEGTQAKVFELTREELEQK